MERLPPGIEFIILPTGIDFTLPGQRAPWDESADIAKQESDAVVDWQNVVTNFGAYVGRT